MAMQQLPNFLKSWKAGKAERNILLEKIEIFRNPFKAVTRNQPLKKLIGKTIHTNICEIINYGTS